MMVQLPYCGAAPLPGDLLARFNVDPIVISALILAAAFQLWRARPSPSGRLASVVSGWVVAAGAFLSPLCALSVALFSARVAQHMILVLIAAPLIALGMPMRRREASWPLGASALGFFLALWFWHMPLPYEASFGSVLLYWCMHLCLFGSAIWLWSELLHHPRSGAVAAIAVGALTSMQMGLLGALLSLADHALFSQHFLSTAVWGLTPLEDQQLGGIIMWVPGIGLFLGVAIRSLVRLWTSLEGARAA
jgi:putative membrane protein